MMFNRLSDNDDFTYLGNSGLPMFKKFSILSNNDSSLATESCQPNKQEAYIPDDSLDLYWNNLNAWKAAA